ncbi:eCIS core domain-containing protein [Pseudarthrobacter sp. YS3]|uniref:eCIS core domain-containing protein n=1 Tax=Pseudarthrobacter sp. YS3 TaxID=3453718 RepID=UPI003EEF5DC3
MTLMRERPVTVDVDAHVAGGHVSGFLARKVVDRLPSAGEPLTAAARTFLGAASGHDLSHVRVHRDEYAADTARAFGARALTAGQHVLIGAGASTDRVLAHEVGHAVSQARAGDPVVQLDAIDQIQDLLSYGVLDWAVTDSEAMESLALLNALPDAQLTAGLARLENKFLNRLLDNLPDAARSGPGYQRVVQALGPARAAGTAVSDLGYGLFDWAVTDTEVTRVYNTFVNLKSDQQEAFLMRLNGVGRLARLVSNSSAGHLSLYLHPWIRTLTAGGLTPDQQKLLRTVVANTFDLVTLMMAAKVRFNMTTGPTSVPGRTPSRWDAGQLRSTYLVLDQLPEAHTATNRELVRLGQFTQPAAGNLITAGVYSASRRELAINAQGSADANTIRHETGHSVDQNIGWSTGLEPGKPERGGWHTYPTHAAAATDMIADAKSGIASLAAPQQADVVAEIATSMTSRSTTGQVARVRARPWYAGLAAPVKTAVTDDPTFEAVGVGLQMPWYREDGGTHLGTHIYQESYTPIWVRYEHQARRPERKLTDYQFRDAGEWFAETYAWYYEPDSRGKGMKLNDKDPDTKSWFDTNVDPIVGTR